METNRKPNRKSSFCTHYKCWMILKIHLKKQKNTKHIVQYCHTKQILTKRKYTNQMHTDKNIHWNLTSCIIWWQSMGQTVKATCAASVCCSSFTLCWLNMKKQQSNNSSLTEAKWDLFTLSAVVWAWCRFSECEALNHNELKKWWWRSNSLAWNKIFISAGSAERMTDRPIHWQSNIVCPLWLSLILLSLSSEVSSADRCQEENSLARKKNSF